MRQNDDIGCGVDIYGVEGRGSFDVFVYPCPRILLLTLGSAAEMYIMDP